MGKSTSSTGLHKHINTCAARTHNHRVFWLCPGEAKLLCDWGELWYCHQSINQPLPTPGQARESYANMALPHTRCYVRVCAGSKGDQTTATADRAMTLNVWLRQESNEVNQIKFELGKEVMEFNHWYRWSCRWQSEHLRLVYWRHKRLGSQPDKGTCEWNITVLKDIFERSYETFFDSLI